MKRIFPLLLSLLLLCGCGKNQSESDSGTYTPPPFTIHEEQSAIVTPAAEAIPFSSRFDSETLVTLSDEAITWEGDGTVILSHDIIYYEDRDVYDSGYPYGEGTAADKHTAAEAAAHTVVNITSPGTYRVTGTLSVGQIRVDLGENACEDPNAVVELILDNASITCTVAPAILFLNVYECDGDRSVDTATPTVATSDAGAVLVLADGSRNTVNGSYVAKIYKDKEGEKKLWKQDAALYSYMSLNIFGEGTLDLTAGNEGMGTEMHLTINGGNLNIRSQDDGINTNEDGVSVTTINGGTVHIVAGLGSEGDGIDSNGYLVINGGTVISSADPAADAGLDSDLGSYVNGGTVLALGSTMDWAESDSQQVTMNLQFSSYRTGDGAIVITREDGGILFAYDPSEDEVLGSDVRRYMGAIISSPSLQVGEIYHVYVGGTITGTDKGGLYLTETITGYTDGLQQVYTGTDVGMPGFGGFGHGSDGEMPEMPEGGFTPPNSDAQIPEDGQFPGSGQRPDGFPSEGEDRPEPPENGFGGPQGQRPTDQDSNGITNTLFYMNDKVNSFSGVADYIG